MLAAIIGLPLAQASHWHSELKPLTDAGVTFVITQDGTPPKGTVPGPNLRVMSAAEWVATYEHPDDPLNNLPPLSSVPTSLGSTDDVVEGRSQFNPSGSYLQHHNMPAIGWGAECMWTGVDYYCEGTVRPANDWRHAPTGGCNWSKSDTAFGRFVSTYSQIRFERRCVVSSCFDLDNIGSSVSYTEILSNFANDVLNVCSPSYQTERFQVSFGWVDAMDHNGAAWRNDWFGVGTAYTCWGCFKWDNDEILQHEISHLFNADDRNGDGDSGIMNYWDAYWGASHWAEPDYSIVGNNLKACTNCYGTNVGEPS